MSLALQRSWYAWNRSPETADEAARLFADRQEALETLRNHPEEAASSIIADLQASAAIALEPRMSGMLMLGDFESSAGISYLVSQTALAVPSPTLELESPETSAAAVATRLRRLATEQLGKLAANGSLSAQGHLLSLVAGGDDDLRKHAIRAYYDAFAPSERWRAKREMARRLPVGQHHLLYEIY